VRSFCCGSCLCLGRSSWWQQAQALWGWACRGGGPAVGAGPSRASRASPGLRTEVLRRTGPPRASQGSLRTEVLRRSGPPRASQGSLRTEVLRRTGPPRVEVLRRSGPPRVETLGYDWDNKVRRGAPVLESGLKSTRRHSRLMLGREWSGALRLFWKVD
jgi:hypothetical protein